MTQPRTEWRLAHGTVDLDPATGSPLQLHHDRSPRRRYLLTEGHDVWHSAEHRWGTGFLATDAGSWRWRHPAELTWGEQRLTARYDLGGTLALLVERWVDEAGRLAERHTLTNPTSADVTVTTWGVNTPFRDVYDDAATSLDEGVHAHVWPGGSASWVLAVPMDGGDGVLSLVLDEGRLDAYSIDSRNAYSSSNVRGHVVLHPTDAARSPEAFGGQPEIVLPAGGSHRLAWSVGWEDGVAGFEARVRPDAVADRYAAPVGERVLLGEVTDPGAVRIREPRLARVVQDDAGRVLVEGTGHGVVHVDVGEARIGLLFHLTLEEVVRARVRYVLDRQRPVERGDLGAAAFVPLDTRTGLTWTTNGWPDWSDGAERVAMPTLLQEAYARGWVDDPDEVREALAGWARFACARLLDDTAAPRWGSISIVDRTRLYNAPWLAHFFAEQHRLFGSADDLELAARILERAEELGAGHHLSIGQPEVVVLLGGLLEAAGQPERAEALRAALRRTAEHFATVARDLPSHEVNYEQSMVAPLVSLFAAVHALDGEYADELAETVRWLRAFAGPQPHARLHHVPIRHWDGYWFGIERMWGDVFPHHWSALSATALSQLPASLQDERTRAESDAVFTANLASFHPDGSATCAFVMPSAVDGRPGYREDPLANDQDWSLTLWLRTLPR